MPASDQTGTTGVQTAAYLSERREDIKFDEKDTGLRHDVHDLGIMVGELLQEQGGKALFDAVEAARRYAIERREGNSEAGQKLDALVASMSADLARNFIRAFSTYFQVVNTAEQVHRIRRRRDYLKDATTSQPGGVEESIFKLREAGLGLTAVEDILRTILVEPIFTAHSTEPTRRTILRKQQNIVRRLVEIQNPALTPQETAACMQSIRSDITAIWQTEETPGEDRTVFDEQEHVLFYFTDVIYRALPALYETLERALRVAFGEQAERFEIPPIVRFGSWIGGDFDARPEITARTIREIMARQRGLILDLYYQECRVLSDKLSQSTTRVEVSEAVANQARAYAEHFPNAAGRVPLRHREMPYRTFLRLVMQRLQSTYDDDVFPYESADELQGDIQLIADSLRDNGGTNAGLFSVNRLLRRIQTFGFHFLTLDVRQNALSNRAVVGRCLGEDGWSEQSSEYRADRIRLALERNESPCIELDNESRRILSVFQAIAYCRRRYGERAIGAYVVSMAHGVDDVLSVILLARWGDLGRGATAVPLDIAPYFETVDDLADSATQMRKLFENPIYRQHLRHRDNQQTIMVSYSDSNRDTGLASARWSVQKAQAELVRVLDDCGIALILFHGRGGTISRGGGKTHAAVLGSPAGAVRGRLRATEQGELVNAKYGLRGIALRTLEQAVGSVALATALPARKRADESSDWPQIMETIANASRDQYQALVYDSPSFSDYFRKATPVDIIERMRFTEIAGGGDVSDLKTVPWDFAWTQSRHMLPGWYGFGTGLAAALDEFGMPKIREALNHWYFFRALITDVETVLARSDLSIASRYSQLAGDLHEEFFPLMENEFALAKESIIGIRDQKTLLEGNNTLRRSIRLRNPYVDPMSLLQVELLRRWRSGGAGDPILYEALVASVNGIARGLQDSG